MFCLRFFVVLSVMACHVVLVVVIRLGPRAIPFLVLILILRFRLRVLRWGCARTPIGTGLLRLLEHCGSLQIINFLNELQNLVVTTKTKSKTILRPTRGNRPERIFRIIFLQRLQNTNLFTHSLIYPLAERRDFLVQFNFE